MKTVECTLFPKAPLDFKPDLDSFDGFILFSNAKEMNVIIA